MYYDYQCPNKECNKSFEISKAMKDCSREEHCFQCDTIMKRIYTAPAVNFSNTDFFSTVMNKHIGCTGDIDRFKEEYKRNNNGSELNCIGNESLDSVVTKKDTSIKLSTKERREINSFVDSMDSK